MRKILVLVLSITFLISISGEVVSSSINILSNNNGYYVEVQQKKGSTSSTYQMQLALYTSETVLTTGILGFSSFTCSNPDCTLDKQDEITFPECVLKGSRMKLSLSLTQNWSFDTTNYMALLANSYSGNPRNFGNGVAGFIGMGTLSNGRTTPNVFSTYFEEDTINGRLIFSFNEGYTKSNTSILSWTADQNWIVNNINTFYIGESFVQSDFKVIFDLNRDEIAFPAYVYDQIIGTLSDSGYKCASVDGLFSCTGSIALDSFPVFKIGVQGKTLSIQPKHYIKNYVAGATQADPKLKFTFLDPSNKAPFYTSTPFEDFIVLGKPILTSYYMVFDSQNKLISFYTPVPKFPTTATDGGENPASPTNNTNTTNTTTPTNPNTTPDTQNGNTTPGSNNTESSSNSGSNSKSLTYIFIGGGVVLLLIGYCLLKVKNQARSKDSFIDKKDKNAVKVFELQRHV